MSIFEKIKGVFNTANDATAVLSTLDYKSPSGGYMNYAVFSVTGTNPKTNRKNKRKYECKTSNEAMALAAADLINIESVEAIPFEPPTERQCAACKEHGRIIPPGACSIDVSFLMTRDIEHQKPAPKELIRSADSMGLKFSYLTGEETLRNLINENK